MPGSRSIIALSSRSFSRRSVSIAAASAPACLARLPSSDFSAAAASLNLALIALRSARSLSISVFALRTSASSASKWSRSRLTPLSLIARSTASRLALTKSSASIASAYRKLVEVQPPVPPAKEQQRIYGHVEARFDHLPDKDVMVAAVMHCMAFAFEHPERILEDRRACL